MNTLMPSITGYHLLTYLVVQLIENITD